jgi:predicted signal transduction protein with EAL and GGDEF domain
MVWKISILFPRGTRIPVTASFGVSNVEGLTWRQMIGKADVALYAAKQAGRNCIRLAEQDVLVGSELVATEAVRSLLRVTFGRQLCGYFPHF